jgi:glycosyltransferase involved in cell wall biosynthesis
LLNACDGGVATLRAVEFTKGAIPVKLFEMMACGLPVVLAGWGESEEILQASGGGYSVPCEDGARLAEALERLAADPEKATAMGEKGRAFIVAEYDRRKLADRFLDIL